jgi:predicted O-methyltransferase YrrM
MAWPKIANVEGFFSETNYLVWRTFLDFQARQNITGNLFEIGVWKGRSAAALTLHRKPGEILILVDFLIEHFKVAETLRSKCFDTTDIIWISKKSEAFGRMEMIEAERTVRWFHIDGDHSAEATYADIALADRFISPQGVIVLDDFFNPRYVSVAWAAFDYLRNHPHSLRMILAGDNKAYLCRPSQLAMYREFLLDDLPAQLVGTGLALQQGSPLFDCATLGLSDGWRGPDYTFIGLDTDLEHRAHERVTLIR